MPQKYSMLVEKCAIINFPKYIHDLVYYIGFSPNTELKGVYMHILMQNSFGVKNGIAK